MVHEVDAEIRAYKVDVFVRFSSDVNMELCWWDLPRQFGSVGHLVIACLNWTLDLCVVVFGQLADVEPSGEELDES